MTAPSTPRIDLSRAVLQATGISHGYADRRVLTDVDLVVSPGRRLALVGDNGSGKSTLLRLLAGTEQPDAGTVERPADTALLEQDLDHDTTTTIHDVVEGALEELRAAARQVQELGALVARIPDDRALAREYGDALEWAQLREAWDADHRVQRVLRGLGLDHMPRSRRVVTLSGGERARVAMAALLVRQPRALLLDEPTNHLDDAGVAFLERHIAALPGLVVIASHDRAFLDATCTELVDLDPTQAGRLRRFGGTFSDYLQSRASERERWERAWRDQQVELERLAAAAGTVESDVAHGRAPRDNDKFIGAFKGARVERTVARRRRAARERIAAIQRDPIRQPPQPLRFRTPFGATERELDEPLVRLAGVTADGRLEQPTTLDLAPGARLLVTGANGAGKTTLLDVIAGDLTPTSGTIEWIDGLRAARLVQDPVFVDLDSTPRAVYDSVARELADAPDLELLGLLREDDLDRPIGALSEGQRRRVALAMLVAHGPELLLLDEPTNHLSPALVSDLEQALLASPAAVVIASHDRWLRARWTGSVLHIGAD
jgi:macrolide transport system ATP-binding/permease protein